MDKTNYFQSVVHILKGNLGSGILAMPVAFKHLGYAGAIIALPVMCFIAAYCVHVLVRSSQRVSEQLDDSDLSYSILARRSFELGPGWLKGSGELVDFVVDFALLVTQIGVCCVYIIFVVDNITSILASHDIHIPQILTFLAILPVTILLSFIRTLNRLAIASLVANLLQVVGLALILEYLLRDFKHLSVRHRRAFGSSSEMWLGFGSVMFAFEGISVVLPVYNRLERRQQFGSLFGVINVSFLIILVLDFSVGFLGYMKYGQNVKDSITLNLPAETLYDAVRAMFTASILLTYPLQLYVPNEIIWQWLKRKLIKKTAPTSSSPRESEDGELETCDTSNHDVVTLRYEYCCRLLVVLLTFTLAICVPKLNLLMAFVGSFSSNILCLTLPALIHIVSHWAYLNGFKRYLVISVDSTIVILSLAAELGGSYSSLIAIIDGFRHENKQ